MSHHTNSSTLYYSITPSGILHIVAFVTLCEAYMGIEPHFDLLNHFFHVRLPQGSGVEVVVLCGMDIYVKSRHGVDPYVHLNMWWKVWFFLRNDDDEPLLVFKGSRLVPQPNWRYKVARRYLHKLQS
jgi:hypothetical protein